MDFTDTSGQDRWFTVDLYLDVPGLSRERGRVTRDSRAWVLLCSSSDFLHLRLKNHTDQLFRSIEHRAIERF